VGTRPLIAPSLTSSLPLRPLFPACAPLIVGAWLRRGAVRHSSVFCPAGARVAGSIPSLSSAVVLRPPLASRGGVMAAVVRRFRPGRRCVSSWALQRLRFASMPLLLGYSPAVFSRPMFMHTPSPNTAVERTPNKRALFDHSASRGAPHFLR